MGALRKAFIAGANTREPNHPLDSLTPYMLDREFEDWFDTLTEELLTEVGLGGRGLTVTLDDSPLLKGEFTK